MRIKWDHIVTYLAQFLVPQKHSIHSDHNYNDAEQNILPLTEKKTARLPWYMRYKVSHHIDLHFSKNKKILAIDSLIAVQRNLIKHYKWLNYPHIHRVAAQLEDTRAQAPSTAFKGTSPRRALATRSSNLLNTATIGFVSFLLSLPHFTT